MDVLKQVDPEIFEAIREEIEREQSHVELIASEIIVVSQYYKHKGQ